MWVRVESTECFTGVTHYRSRCATSLWIWVLGHVSKRREKTQGEVSWHFGSQPQASCVYVRVLYNSSVLFKTWLKAVSLHLQATSISYCTISWYSDDIEVKCRIFRTKYVQVVTKHAIVRCSQWAAEAACEHRVCQAGCRSVGIRPWVAVIIE